MNLDSGLDLWVYLLDPIAAWIFYVFCRYMIFCGFILYANIRYFSVIYTVGPPTQLAVSKQDDEKEVVFIGLLQLAD